MLYEYLLLFGSGFNSFGRNVVIFDWLAGSNPCINYQYFSINKNYDFYKIVESLDNSPECRQKFKNFKRNFSRDPDKPKIKTFIDKFRDKIAFLYLHWRYCRAWGFSWGFFKYEIFEYQFNQYLHNRPGFSQPYFLPQFNSFPHEYTLNDFVFQYNYIEDNLNLYKKKHKELLSVSCKYDWYVYYYSDEPNLNKYKWQYGSETMAISQVLHNHNMFAYFFDQDIDLIILWLQSEVESHIHFLEVEDYRDGRLLANLGSETTNVIETLDRFYENRIAKLNGYRNRLFLKYDDKYKILSKTCKFLSKDSFNCNSLYTDYKNSIIADSTARLKIRYFL